MAELGQSFDQNAVEASKFDDLPVGEYIAAMVESEVKETKEKTGKLIAATWEVTQPSAHGDFTGRKFWQNINFENASAQAQLIGQQQLKAICNAVGYTEHVTDTEVLHNVECRVTMGMGKANNSYAAKPEVKKVKPLSLAVPEAKQGATAAPAAAKPATAAAPAAARGPGGAAKPAGPGGSRPWLNKAPGVAA